MESKRRISRVYTQLSTKTLNPQLPEYSLEILPPSEGTHNHLIPEILTPEVIKFIEAIGNRFYTDFERV